LANRRNWQDMGVKISILHEFSRKILAQQSLLTLTTNELDILTLIVLENGQLTPNGISQKLNLKKESVSRTLKKMIENGFVEKTANKQDDRSSLLIITEEAITILDENYKLLLKPYYYIEERIGQKFDQLIDNIVVTNQLLNEFDSSEKEK
jgi:DNA-binding MarR family transcriptional regulator